MKFIPASEFNRRIKMPFNDIERKKHEKELEAFIEKRRPPADIRDEVINRLFNITT